MIIRHKTTIRLILLITLVMAACLSSAIADDDTDDAPNLFTAIHAGDEAVLDDGRTVRLTGIKAPPVGSGSLAQQSLDLLRQLTDHVPVTLGNPQTDRYGRTTAQIYLMPEDGKKVWLQQEILRHGMAFVYPPTGSEPRLDDMLAAEYDAYRQHRGIWKDPAYADVPAKQAQDLYGHFAFVTGKVIRAERVKNIVYLNFGDDWRHDFTVSVAAHDLKIFRKAGIDPLAYQGKTIRVRGWIKRDYGPMITATSPYQIQILDHL